jgi:hypothetical protein
MPGEENLLNFTCTKLGSLDTLGNNFVLIFMLCRASGGRNDRNKRAVFAFGEKGLKTVDTSVMNLVIIVAEAGGAPILQKGQQLRSFPYLTDLLEASINRVVGTSEMIALGVGEVCVPNKDQEMFRRSANSAATSHDMPSSPSLLRSSYNIPISSYTTPEYVFPNSFRTA